MAQSMLGDNDNQRAIKRTMHIIRTIYGMHGSTVVMYTYCLCKRLACVGETGLAGLSVAACAWIACKFLEDRRYHVNDIAVYETTTNMQNAEQMIIKRLGWNVWVQNRELRAAWKEVRINGTWWSTGPRYGD